MEERLLVKDTPVDYFNLTSDLLCVISHTGRFLSVNSAWEKKLGWKKEDLIDKEVQDYVHEIDVDAFKQFLKVSHRQGMFNIVIRMLSKNNNYISLKLECEIQNTNFLLRCMILNHERLLNLQGIGHSQQLEQVYEGILQTSIVAITDVNGNITFANNNFSKISQYSFAELFGKNHRILKSGVHSDSFYKEMWNTISKGNFWHGEVCNRAKDGSLYWVDTKILPIKSVEGAITSYFSIRFEITDRKRYAENEENQRIEISELIQQASIGIIKINKDKSVPLINKRACDILSISKDEMNHLTLDCLFAKLPLGYTPSTPAIFAGKLPSHHSEMTISSKNQEFYIKNTIFPIHNKTGEITSVVVLMDDISEHRKSENELRKRDALLQGILDHSSSVIYIKNTEGKYILVNHEFEQLTGFAKDFILNKTDFDLFPERYAEKINQNDSDVIMIGRPLNYEDTYPHLEGDKYLFSSKFPIFDNNNKVSGVCSIGYNFSDQKKLYDQLTMMNLRFEMALEAGSFSIWELNFKTQKMILTTPCYKLFGLEQNKFDGSFDSFCLRIHPDDASEFKKQVFNYNEKSLLIEFRILINDDVRIIQSYVKASKRGDGSESYSVGISRDITEVRLHEIQFVQSSKLSTLGEMSAGIAHEINNPLAIISGKVQQMINIIEEPEFKRDLLLKYAQNIEKSSHRISKIVNGLLTYSRDGSKDNFVKISLAEIVSETIEFCQTRFKNHSVELRIKEISQDFNLECRGTQISQVILNLLNNAHDAILNLKEKWVEISVIDSGNTYEIRIRDSGSGIPKSVRDKIMQPFFTTKEVGKGTGLGLSISQGIVKEHGGKLFIDDKDDHTCFVIELPKLHSTQTRGDK